MKINPAGPGSLALAIVAATVTACAHTPDPLDRVAVAYATFASPAGAPRGTAQLWQDLAGVVHVQLQLQGLTPGAHGIHFHQTGKCEGGSSEPFSTAGSHYNPLGRQHGLSNPAGPHAGDAPNIVIGADGTLVGSFTTDRVSLTAGSTGIFDADGTAIVLHASADDQVSQPSGSSGARVACGVIRKTL